MTISQRWTMAAAVALGLSAAGAVAGEPSQQELITQVNELKAKVAALEGRPAQMADTNATIESVLRDAERRSQLLSAGDVGAGYDNGFYIKGDSFELRPGLFLQMRNVTNYRESGKASGENDFENGFEIRRMKLSFEGFAFTPKLQYTVVVKADQNGGGVSLEDAFLTYWFADQWGVRAGQYKDPVNHEELVSSKRQMAVDRTIVNELLGGGLLDRVQGVSLLYGDSKSPLKAEVAVHDGFNSDNTDFRDAATNWGIAGRAEYKVMGTWKDYADFSARTTTEQLLVVGAGTDYTEGDNLRNWNGTIDAQYEQAGLGAYAAILVNNQDNGESFLDWGALAQVGYMVNKQLEVFGRYDIVMLDNDRNLEEDTLHELTAGINYYLGSDGSAGHRAKVTVDLSWLPKGGPNLPGIGVLPTADSEVIVRAQFQLVL